MTKKNAVGFIFLLTVIFLVAIAAFFGFTDARYQSDMAATETIDFFRTVGAISIPNPQWVSAYYDPTDGTFVIDATKHTPGGIGLQVTNQATDGAGTSYTNEDPIDYYIRIVSEDPVLPVEYTVYPYDTWDPENNKYPCDETTGYYGTFTLSSGTEQTTNYFLQVDWIKDFTQAGIYPLKVQMVKKRTGDGSMKVIGETVLKLKISSGISLTLNYYPLGSEERLSYQTVTIEIGKEINFLDADELSRLGIQLPEGYLFSVYDGEDPQLISYATGSALNWAGYYKFEVTTAFKEQNIVNVFLVHKDKIPVTFVCRDRSQPVVENGVTVSKQLSTQIIQIEKGAEIDFKNPTSLSGMGINLPTDYMYIAAHFYAIAVADGVNYYRDNFTIPADTDLKATIVDVYVAPVELRTVDAVLLASDGTEIKTIQIEFAADGLYTFTTATLRGLVAQFASCTSFEIGIMNTTNNATCQVGNPYTNDGAVTVNHFAIYQYPDNIQYQLGYCLANPQMCLYIKAWW